MLTRLLSRPFARTPRRPIVTATPSRRAGRFSPSLEALDDRLNPAGLSGITLTWAYTGAGDGAWNTAANWTTSNPLHPLPDAGDRLVFPAGTGNIQFDPGAAKDFKLEVDQNWGMVMKTTTGFTATYNSLFGAGTYKTDGTITIGDARVHTTSALFEDGAGAGAGSVTVGSSLGRTAPDLNSTFTIGYNTSTLNQYRMLCNVPMTVNLVGILLLESGILNMGANLTDSGSIQLSGNAVVGAPSINDYAPTGTEIKLTLNAGSIDCYRTATVGLYTESLGGTISVRHGGVPELTFGGPARAVPGVSGKTSGLYVTNSGASTGTVNLGDAELTVTNGAYFNLGRFRLYDDYAGLVNPRPKVTLAETTGSFYFRQTAIQLGAQNDDGEGRLTSTGAITLDGAAIGVDWDITAGSQDNDRWTISGTGASLTLLNNNTAVATKFGTNPNPGFCYFLLAPANAITGDYPMMSGVGHDDVGGVRRFRIT
ncbi:MAG: hypothetical protein K2X87_13025 [Gemmataceae bacterium]|nr:hypothetical protein [Gemmataceae bacterium]